MPTFDRFIIVFIEDILIYLPTRELHKEHLYIALKTLRDHRLFGKLSKVIFLGHVVSKNGIRTILRRSMPL